MSTLDDSITEICFKQKVISYGLNVMKYFWNFLRRLFVPLLGIIPSGIVFVSSQFRVTEAKEKKIWLFVTRIKKGLVVQRSNLLSILRLV